MSLTRALPLALLLILALAACNDDDGGDADTLTLDDYFGTVEGIFDNADQDTEELNSELDEQLGSAASIEEEIAALDQYLAGAVLVLDQTVQEMDALTPPVEAEQPHNDFVEAAGEVAEFTGAAQEEIQGAETAEDVDSILDEFETEAAEAQFAVDEACADLQDLADDNGIQADLHCAEPVFPDRPDSTS
jgi:hypothetical protein